MLFYFGCSEVNSTRLITSKVANQLALKLPFTCMVYTNKILNYQLNNTVSWDKFNTYKIILNCMAAMYKQHFKK